MKIISRRQFLYISASLPFVKPLYTHAAVSTKSKLETDGRFPITIAVLKSAYLVEKSAWDSYLGYARKAVEEGYPNIAYLFCAFAASEKIHADNYKSTLTALNAAIEELEVEILISDTKANLINASKKELKKIRKTYPDFLVELKKESHERAVISCMYSWKSHRQHKEKITEIRGYSEIFFGPVAKKIEGMKFDFHICGICGSTLDEAPMAPCNICNFPMLHYHKVKRPA
jgi:rubrerythrin